ncbi:MULTISPECIES: carbohydrate kinase family protein [Nocardiopsis]|uniref:Carbohydrate kinase family protein n=1 Tax=Nocardiopsis alba TaxID=53437 RepID=A0A7K2IN20_9ACTN|nr:MULTISPECIES: carbohydrate kinase family protein [Nocardiopsis]MEC3895637.1 carbohydrate kinase family protein [Nocardiopsis sp. LDBS1602]MYR31256.1 carbohydrate kinase family protein [Nocardiopsis alba]
MRIAVAGSIATDHLMSFEGRFAEQIIPEQIQQLSLSFLIDELDVRRGGVAANICFGLGGFGLNPVLVGAAGEDFEDYRAWLDRHGVDTSAVRISEIRHTARFVCTTDRDQNQIASFYAGAMAEARNIEIQPIADRLGGLDLVLIGADDPAAMVRHSEECRTRGIPFAADPSQQLARMEGPQVRGLIEGASFLFSNEYEKALAEQKTEWSDAEILSKVGTRITTLGPKGARIDREGEPSIQVPAAAVDELVDPTGMGDAFRAGFLAAHSWGLSLERAAQVGNATAVHCLEADGPQEYTLTAASLLERVERSYGSEAADEVRPHL